MSGNLNRFREDIDRLLRTGNSLLYAMVAEAMPDEKKKMSAERIASLPVFGNEYQSWYSESLACVSQLLPLRVNDFKEYYAPAKPTAYTHPRSTPEGERAYPAANRGSCQRGLPLNPS